MEAAKADFLESIKEAKETIMEEGKVLPDGTDAIDVALKFAKEAGIGGSKTRQYKNGLAFAGESTTKKILDTMRSIGAES